MCLYAEIAAIAPSLDDVINCENDLFRISPAAKMPGILMEDRFFGGFTTALFCFRFFSYLPRRFYEKPI